MGIEFVIKIAAIGLIVGLLNQILTKAGRDEYALAVTLAGTLVAVLMLLPELKDAVEQIKDVFGL